MKHIPEDFTEYNGETIMSNCDGIVIQETVDAIKDKKFYSGYPAWDFYGEVWYQDKQWHCQIKCYMIYQETISADTPEELMIAVSSKYGSE